MSPVPLLLPDRLQNNGYDDILLKLSVRKNEKWKSSEDFWTPSLLKPCLICHNSENDRVRNGKKSNSFGIVKTKMHMYVDCFLGHHYLIS